MKRKGLILLGALAAMTLSLALAGCAQDRLTVEDLIEMGYTNTVTIDLMGGRSGERTELIQQVKDNSPIVEPGSQTLAGEAPTRSGYTFGGYFRGTEDENGNVTFGEEWNFATDRVTGDLTLYVRWLTNYSITVHYGDDYASSYTVNVSQDRTGVAQPVRSITISGQTVLDSAFYTNRADAEQKANAITFPYTPPGLSQENTVGELWANTLEGVWRIVEDADDFVIYDNTNIYLMTNIDFGGATLTFPEAYSGTFEGNGHVLSNFKVAQERGSSSTQSYGLFRELRASAVIRDITFKDVTYSAMLTNPIAMSYRAGVLAGYAASGAKVENVTIDGGTFTFVMVEKFYGTLDVDVLIGGDASEDVATGSVISETTTIRKLTESEWDAENTSN